MHIQLTRCRQLMIQSCGEDTAYISVKSSAIQFATHTTFVLFSELRPTLLHTVLINYIIVTLYILIL